MEAYEVALKHISENREAMDRIVEALLEKETLTGKEEDWTSACNGLTAHFLILALSALQAVQAVASVVRAVILLCIDAELISFPGC
jgi:hypothetical protein